MNDGCTTLGQIELGWDCTSEPSVCLPICKDGILKGQETCDDGLLTNSGCKDDCSGILDGYVCTSEIPMKCSTICGDGVLVTVDEECDDGNLNKYDGCSEECKNEF